MSGLPGDALGTPPNLYGKDHRFKNKIPSVAIEAILTIISLTQEFLKDRGFEFRMGIFPLLTIVQIINVLWSMTSVRLKK